MGGEVTVLDGGMGEELGHIGAPFRRPEWSALALMAAPELVATAHRNVATAGADVPTINTDAVVPYHLGKKQFAARGTELADLAGRLARQVADEADQPVRVAGSLPPLFGSYEPDEVEAWVAGGATIAGGCCDMYPEHIAALAARVG